MSGPSGTGNVTLEDQPAGCSTVGCRPVGALNDTPVEFKWAEFREDKMITPAPSFWPIFGPLGPTAGPGSSGNGPGLKNSAGCTENQPRRTILSPSRGHFVFLGPTAKKQKGK